MNLAEPLNGARSARVDINAGDGNLIIDALANGEEELARGTLQYIESQGPPARSLEAREGQAILSLKAESGAEPSGLQLPWAACDVATEWQIHLNPAVELDLTAHSNGGNVRANLAGMDITRISADTGGGNMEVVLPDGVANLSVAAWTGGGNATVEVGNGTTGSSTVDASSGAGNVTVRLPSGLAAKVHATTGAGKVEMDPSLTRTDEDTYQTPDYDSAANRVEITIHSGAGNVGVSIK